jgi:hypothetical protein
MGSPTSVTTDVTTENTGPRRQGGVCSKGSPTAAYYSDERPSQGPWLSEAPPTGVLTGVLGEMASYYGACWLYHRSSPPPRRGRRQ